MNTFNLEEAVSLIYRLAVLKQDAPEPGKKYTITQIGHICGVLTLNDQIHERGISKQSDCFRLAGHLYYLL